MPCWAILSIPCDRYDGGVFGERVNAYHGCVVLLVLKVIEEQQIQMVVMVGSVRYIAVLSW